MSLKNLIIMLSKQSLFVLWMCICASGLLVSCSSSGKTTQDLATAKAELSSVKTKVTELETDLVKLEGEISTLQSRQTGITCGKGENALLKQSGVLSTVVKNGKVEIFYQQPYASPPELIIPLMDIDKFPQQINQPTHLVKGTSAWIEILEQRSNGFRIAVNSRASSGNWEILQKFQWQATGILASSCK